MKYTSGRGRNSTGRGDAGIRTCHIGGVEIQDVVVGRRELLRLQLQRLEMRDKGSVCQKCLDKVETYCKYWGGEKKRKGEERTETKNQ